MIVEHTPGPWSFVPATEHHGPYVTTDFGSTIADCYTMSNPLCLSVLNGGVSKPIPFLHEMAEPNARLIATAPELLAALETLHDKVIIGTIKERHVALTVAWEVIVKAKGVIQ
jgi:hypothetical protein